MNQGHYSGGKRECVVLKETAKYKKWDQVSDQHAYGYSKGKYREKKLIVIATSGWVIMYVNGKNKKFWEELMAYFPWYDTGHIENDASNNSSIIARVFVTAVTFLPSRCQATIRGFLPSRCLATIGRIHTHTQQHNLLSLLYF
jgi:hypothetical protein